MYVRNSDMYVPNSDMYVRNSDMYVRHRKGSNARRIINNNNLLVRPHIGYGSNTGAASYSDYYQPHYGQDICVSKIIFRVKVQIPRYGCTK